MGWGRGGRLKRERIIYIYILQFKKPRVISINAGKSFDKNRILLIMITLQKVVIEEAYLSKINPNMTNPQLTSYSMVKNRRHSF